MFSGKVCEKGLALCPEPPPRFHPFIPPDGMGRASAGTPEPCPAPRLGHAAEAGEAACREGCPIREQPSGTSVSAPR